MARRYVADVGRMSNKLRPPRTGPATCSICYVTMASAFILLFLIAVFHQSPVFQALNLPTDAVPVYGYKIVNEYPHDPGAFVQGLVYAGNDTLYESTGLYGRSSIREVQLQSGKVMQLKALGNEYFGEGLTLWDQRLVQVLWRTSKGFFYNKKTFVPMGTFKHPMSDGWGLTYDGKYIIGSDGSSSLYFLQPGTFSEVRKLTVAYKEEKVKYLNELEYVNGEIWANVWQTECIVRVSPKDGRVIGWVVLHGLRDKLIATSGNKYLDVLNGIAWDAEKNRIFVTGKLWPKLFEIDLQSTIHSPTDQYQTIRKTCILP